MKTSSIFRSVLCASTAHSLLVVALLSSPAHAQDQSLGSVTVTDTPIDDSEAQTSYKVSRSISATRTDTPLIDVPQSVNVISVKQIEDQAANSIGDAIRYVPGVFSAQGEGNRETLVFRGNSTTGDFFVDGVRDDVQTYRDLYNIERLEIFKGPNAMIFGRGGIGGIVNRVTKVADWNLHRAFRIEVGSFEHKRAQFDLGTPLSDFAAVRVTGVYQDSDSYRDGVNYNRWGFNPTASFKLSPDTTVTLGYEHFQDDRIADRGVPARFGASPTNSVGPLRTPRGQFFGDPTQSMTGTNTDAGSLFIEHQFSDTMSIRNRTRYADYKKFYSNVFPGAVDTTETMVSISAYRSPSARENFINQTDFNATFDTGSIQHTLLIGGEYGHQKSANMREEGRFAGNASSVTVPISASNIRLPITWTQIASSTNNDGLAEVFAGYVQDQIALSPMFDIVVGVRYEHFKTKVHDRRSVTFRTSTVNGVTTVSPEFFDVTDDLWSPRAGLIFKPIENASIYASYSRTYQPRGGDQLAGLNLSNSSLAPEKFQNYEIGAKWDIVPTFNVSAAVFQLDRANVLALSNPNDATSVTVPVGRQRTKGVELSAAGSITNQVSMVGAYTYSDGTFLDNVSGTVRAGNQLPNMPKHAASLWTRFDPIEQLGAGVGVIYQGKRYAATDNQVYLPGYTRVDGAIFYTIAPELSLQVNVENILGKRYYLYAHSNNNITPGSPTAVKVGLNARF